MHDDIFLINDYLENIMNVAYDILSGFISDTEEGMNEEFENENIFDSNLRNINQEAENNFEYENLDQKTKNETKYGNIISQKRAEENMYEEINSFIFPKETYENIFKNSFIEQRENLFGNNELLKDNIYLENIFYGNSNENNLFENIGESEYLFENGGYKNILSNDIVDNLASKTIFENKSFMPSILNLQNENFETQKKEAGNLFGKGNITLNISNNISVREDDDIDYIIEALAEKIASYAKEASEGSHI